LANRLKSFYHVHRSVTAIVGARADYHNTQARIDLRPAINFKIFSACEANYLVRL